MNNIDEKLAKGFASSPAQPAQSLQGEYNLLNNSAVKAASKVARRYDALDQAWSELLPTLDQMQALLSQRGADRQDAGEGKLPTWTEWLKAFLKATGLGVTMWTIQSHLVKLRGLGKIKAQPSDPPLKLSSPDQRRLLQAVQCCNELIAAFEHGGDYQQVMEDYKRIAMGPDKLEQLLEAIPNDSVFSTGPSVLPAPAGAHSMEGAVSRGCPGPAVPAQPSLSLPKAGSWSGLVDFVCGTAGEGIKAALDGLDPRHAAEILQRSVSKIVGTYCPCPGQIAVEIKYVDAGTASVRRAA